MEPTTAELAEAVQQVARRLRHGTRDRLAPLGLTPGQGRALSVLSRAGRPLRMAELAEALRVVPRSATGVIDGLQDAGLVRRETDPANRRSVLVTLTEPGRGVLHELDRARRRTAEELFGVLPAADQRALLDLLGRVDAQDARRPGDQGSPGRTAQRP